jgi:archaellum biogenesis protein FlaJ (TadC family)
MKISNILLSAMISASFLVSSELNAQKIKKPISESEKTKLLKSRKLALINKTKKYSLKKAYEFNINQIEKYCPGCGKG